MSRYSKEITTIESKELTLSNFSVFKKSLNSLACRRISDIWTDPELEPNLRVISRSFENDLSEHLEKMVKELSLSLGVNWNSFQCKLISDFIMEKMHSWKLSDVKLCFRMIARGDFAKMFNRIGTDVIIGFLWDYNSRVNEFLRGMESKRILEEKTIKEPPNQDVLVRMNELSRNITLGIRKAPEFTRLQQYSSYKGYSWNKFYRKFSQRLSRMYALDDRASEMTFDKYAEFKTKQFLRNRTKRYKFANAANKV